MSLSSGSSFKPIMGFSVLLGQLLSTCVPFSLVTSMDALKRGRGVMSVHLVLLLHCDPHHLHSRVVWVPVLPPLLLGWFSLHPHLFLLSLLEVYLDTSWPIGNTRV